MSATLSYDDIVWACTNLCDLIEFENEALARHDARTVGELAENKAALARIYEQAVAPMAAEPALAEALEPEQKEELMALGQRLKTLVEANARALKAEMDATRMVMDAVVGAVKTNSTSTTHYTRTGTFDGAGTGEANSVSFNQTL